MPKKQPARRTASGKHTDAATPELQSQISRVMGQRQTCIDLLMRAASEPTNPTAERIKAATMMLQATAEYVHLDAKLNSPADHEAEEE